MTVPIAVHIRIRIPPSACNALSAASLLNGKRMSRQMLIATNAHDKTKYGPKNVCLFYLDKKRKGFIFRTSKTVGWRNWNFGGANMCHLTPTKLLHHSKRLVLKISMAHFKNENRYPNLIFFHFSRKVTRILSINTTCRLLKSLK